MDIIDRVAAGARFIVCQESSNSSLEKKKGFIVSTSNPSDSQRLTGVGGGMIRN